LGAASSFDPGVAATDHRIGARESAAVGLKQIYSPMVDVSHEPRDNRGRFVVEPGRIDVYAGDSSNATLTKSFTVR
jgi:beta-glucosidase